jgi:hypothetical protein
MLLRSGTTSLNYAEHVSAELDPWAIRWWYCVVSPKMRITLRRAPQVTRTPQNSAAKPSHTTSSIPTHSSLFQSPFPPYTAVAPVILCSCAVLLGLLSLDGAGAPLRVIHPSNSRRTSTAPEKGQVQPGNTTSECAHTSIHLRHEGVESGRQRVRVTTPCVSLRTHTAASRYLAGDSANEMGRRH